jgi:hypothetical protein
LSIFNNKGSPVEVREAAAHALGECLKGSTLEASSEAFRALSAAVAETDEKISSAAGFAIGKAHLSGDAARAALEAHRIE